MRVVRVVVGTIGGAEVVTETPRLHGNQRRIGLVRRPGERRERALAVAVGEVAACRIVERTFRHRDIGHHGSCVAVLIGAVDVAGGCAVGIGSPPLR